MADGAREDEAVHTHDCSRCAYVWQCRQSRGSHPEDDFCAICEALDRMQNDTPSSRHDVPLRGGEVIGGRHND